MTSISTMKLCVPNEFLKRCILKVFETISKSQRRRFQSKLRRYWKFKIVVFFDVSYIGAATQKWLFDFWRIKRPLKVKILFSRFFSQTCKKNILREIVLFFVDKLVELDCNRKFHRWYRFVIDITDTKLFKSYVISSK